MGTNKYTHHKMTWHFTALPHLTKHDTAAPPLNQTLHFVAHTPPSHQTWDFAAPLNFALNMTLLPTHPLIKHETLLNPSTSHQTLHFAAHLPYYQIWHFSGHPPIKHDTFLTSLSSYKTWKFATKVLYNITPIYSLFTNSLTLGFVSKDLVYPIFHPVESIGLSGRESQSLVKIIQTFSLTLSKSWRTNVYKKLRKLAHLKKKCPMIPYISTRYFLLLIFSLTWYYL